MRDIAEEFSIGNMAPVVPVSGNILSRDKVAKPAKLDYSVEEDDVDMDKIKDDITSEFDAIDLMVPGSNVTEDTDTSDDSKKIEYLINKAENKKFKDSDCRKWCDDLSVDNTKNIKKIESYDFGYSWGDENGNHIVYSFKKKAFYYFDHESTSNDNLKRVISKSKAIDKVEEYDTWNGKKYIHGKKDNNYQESSYITFDDDEQYCLTESKKAIDEDIKPLIDKLNEKGYKTKYSCSGHPSARVKRDKFRDGILYNKLYSTARIVFDDNYDLSAPKGWKKKVLNDGENFSIYVKPPTFKIVDGLPKDAFYKWKQKYMNSLTTWVDNLPNAGEVPDTDGSDIEESVIDDLLIDAL